MPGAPGWFSDESLRKRASVAADVEAWAWDALGEVMHAILNPASTPGPPYTHTIVPPEPIGEDEDGDPLYPEPGSAMTLTQTASPYRQEIIPDAPPEGGCYWPIGDAPGS